MTWTSRVQPLPVHRVPAMLEGGPRDGEQVLTWDYVRVIEVAYEPASQDCDRMICSGWYRPDPDRPGVWTWCGHAPHGNVTGATELALPRLRWWTRLAHAWQDAVIEFTESWRRTRR